MTALALTTFDELVLREIPRDGNGVRVKRIVERVQGYHQRHTTTWQHTRDDIVGVLRGLEHLGHIEQRNGWWRRTG